MDQQPDRIGPQPGPQEAFLSSPADIVIYGGAAGGGKTYGLLLECLRHVGRAGFFAVILRREAVQISNPGGLWDTAMGIYPLAGGIPRRSPNLRFGWRDSKVAFAHLNRDGDVLDYQGSQIALICFDELTHFSEYQFWYMLSRNRSLCGVRPYVRATTNPDADSWVAQLIAWWVDETGAPIQERAGVLRYFIRVGDTITWGDSPAELIAEHGAQPEDVKSLTFIPARVDDNLALMRADPGYVANLRMLPIVERERLLNGNWKIRPAAGLYFPRDLAHYVHVPPDCTQIFRAWDLAATAAPDADATASVKLGRTASGRYVVLDVTHFRRAAHDVRQAILATAQSDGRHIPIVLPQDPGQAGKDQAQSLVALLAGHIVKLRAPSRDKITRALPFASQWQAGGVDLVAGDWTAGFVDELDGFPDGAHDDRVDAASDAFAELQGGPTYVFGRR